MLSPKIEAVPEEPPVISATGAMIGVLSRMKLLDIESRGFQVPYNALPSTHTRQMYFLIWG